MLKYKVENYTKGGVDLDNKLNTDEIKNINAADATPAADDVITPVVNGDAATSAADDTATTSTAEDTSTSDKAVFAGALTDNESRKAEVVDKVEASEPCDTDAQVQLDGEEIKDQLTDEPYANDEASPAEPIQEEFIIPDDPFSAISISSELQPIEEQSYEFEAALEGGDTELGAEDEVDAEDAQEAASDDEPAASADVVESVKNEAAPLLCSAAGEESAAIATPSRPYKEEKYDPDNPRKVDFIFDFLELFVFTLVAVLIVTTFFVRHSIVEGDSMLNTLHNGDTLIISDLFYEPKQNDIIVIESSDLGKAIVKRVIAVGGDRVMVKPDGIYVNGEKLYEPYVYTDGADYLYDLRRCGKLRDNPSFRLIPGSHYEFTVPKGEVFVMGDHRSDSTDSRDLGTLPVDAILGKVLWRILPFDSFGAIK